MVDYLLAMGLILFVLAGWIFVQQWARKFAAQYPEFGSAKEEGGGCGKSCGCSHNHCKKTRDHTMILQDKTSTAQRLRDDRI